jgi:hypothetical protein
MACGKTSPYWPEGMSWNPKEAFETIGSKLGDLKSVVQAGPYRGIPNDLQCICTGEYCMLKILDHVCNVQNIPRITIPKVLIPEDPLERNLVMLIPHIAMRSQWARFIKEVGFDKASALNLSISKKKESEISSIKTSWGVEDIDALCDAICTKNCTFWKTLIGLVSKF